METGTIINQLIYNKCITEVEQNALRSARDKLGFLQTLVKIYEDKTQLYLRACTPIVQQALEDTPADQRAQKALEKTMECAYSLFLEYDKFSVVPSLKLLLHSDHDLSISMGIKPLNENLEIAKKVFLGYVARYRLFRSIDNDQLQALIEEVGAENREVFPSYLLNAFRIETEISLVIKHRLQGNAELQTSHYLAEMLQSSRESITACLQGIIFYLGSLINRSSLSIQLRERHFYHLTDDTTHLAFTHAIAEGYVDMMSQQHKQLEVIQANMKILSSQINKTCLPALSLLGIPIEVDLSALKSRLQAIEKSLDDHANAMAAFNQEIDKARQDAYQKINQWRSQIPNRPITFGIQIGIPLK